MTDLQAGALRAQIRPDHGFDITSITLHGHEILAVMPWQAGPVAAAADEDTWTRAWTGGWQLAAPSSGNVCVADGIRQGFHGNASQAAWVATGHSTDSASATWEDDAGLRLERTIALADNGARITTTARNVGGAARHLIVTEHLIFGSELLAGDATLEASGHVRDIDAHGRAASEPAPWPNGWDRIETARPTARFSALCNSEAHVTMTNQSGLAVTVRWDQNVLPHAWLWQEIEATSEQPWTGRGRALGIEPSMTAHASGLASAAEDGTARRLQPGDSVSWHVEVAIQTAESLGNSPDRPHHFTDRSIDTP